MKSKKRKSGRSNRVPGINNVTLIPVEMPEEDFKILKEQVQDLLVNIMMKGMVKTRSKIATVKVTKR